MSTRWRQEIAKFFKDVYDVNFSEGTKLFAEDSERKQAFLVEQHPQVVSLLWRVGQIGESKATRRVD